ncbi:MmgE/PrpD family protein [Lysinibacillus fusiformis]|nr:MmgE/PrpD family protein [Lysinibacillus fusiformis]
MRSIAEKMMNRSFQLTEENTIAAKKVLLDTIGTLIMGMNEKEQRRLVQQFASISVGDFALIASDKKVNKLSAAFLMGVASVAVELDEGNQWSKGHPAVHVVPMLLLHAQEDPHYAGKDFLMDLVKSYEFCTHFGKITTLKPSLHAHGTWGVLGAAVAYGIAKRATTEELGKLIDIAATFATPTKWEAALEGSSIRNVYVAEALEGAVKAWHLLQAGFEAPNGNTTYIFSQLLGSSMDVEKPLETSFDAIEKNYFKQHAFCRYVHVPLENFQSLIEKYHICISDIAHVNISTYQRASTLNKQITENILSSKFSIPFALASWYHLHRTDHTVFQEQAYLDETIRALATKINVVHDPIFDVNYPTEMAAKVSILMTNGTIVEQTLLNAVGGPNSTLNMQELVNKFTKNSQNILTKEGASRIISFIEQIEEQPSMKRIYDLINDK